jgi:hypothetical protein
MCGTSVKLAARLILIKGEKLHVAPPVHQVSSIERPGGNAIQGVAEIWKSQSWELA